MQEAEASNRCTTARAEEAETRVQKIEERLTKTEIARWLDAKDKAIQRLIQQLVQQQEEKRQQEEQILELEEYVCIQEDYITNQMAEAELKAIATQEEHEKDNRQWELRNSELQNRCTELEGQYERKRLDLLVAEAKLMQAEGSANVQLTDLCKQLAKAQYRVSLGEEKINAILKRHRIYTLKLVFDSLDKGKTWSAQAVELQLLRADRDNRKTQGQGFFKMTRGNVDCTRRDCSRFV